MDDIDVLRIAFDAACELAESQQAELTRLRAENAALIAERAAPVQPVQAPMTERERRAPARREEMAAFAAELKADPVKAQRFFHEAGILDAQGNLTPQYGGREQALPDGWVPLVVTLPDSHPEEVAYGPKVMMDRLGKWLAKHFAAVQAQGEPVAWRIFDGEGNYDYRDDPPDEFNVSWSARYGRKYQPLYLHPPRAEVQRLRAAALALLNELDAGRHGAQEFNNLRNALRGA